MPRILIPVLWLSFVICSYADSSRLASLEREAKLVLDNPDNVFRRKHITPVFKLAEEYATSGHTNQAIRYYTTALEHQPWNLSAQLSLARLLNSIGDTNGCHRKAELVFANAESDALLEEAALILNQPFTNQLPKEAMSQSDGCSLVLVPFEGIDLWLVLALREDLSRILRVPVSVQKFTINTLKPERDPLDLRARELREIILKSQGTTEVQTLQKQLNISVKALTNNDAVFNFAEKLLEAGPGHEQANRLRAEIDTLRRLGPQWNATQVLKQVAKATDSQPGSRTGYLGITLLDLFSGESRFVFGLAANNGNCGVISYRRFTSAILDTPPNQQLLRERALKQALSSTGFMFGLPRCTDPTCARAYANGLEEHDAKKLKLCEDCQSGFEKRFDKTSK